MPYINFNNTKPVEHKDCCAKCIHKIHISENLCRCSILNKFMFNDQILAERCTYIDEVIDKHRKVIFGIFAYEENAELQWTGLLTYGNIINKNDADIIEELHNKAKEELYKQYPILKNITLLYFLIAESTDDNGFKLIGNLLPKNVLMDVIKDANSKFL